MPRTGASRPRSRARTNITMVITKRNHLWRRVYITCRRDRRATPLTIPAHRTVPQSVGNHWVLEDLPCGTTSRSLSALLHRLIGSYALRASPCGTTARDRGWTRCVTQSATSRHSTRDQSTPTKIKERRQIKVRRRRRRGTEWRTEEEEEKEAFQPASLDHLHCLDQ